MGSRRMGLNRLEKLVEKLKREVQFNKATLVGSNKTIAFTGSAIAAGFICENVTNVTIELQNGGGKIFDRTNQTQTVWESHNDEVHIVPEGFFITASSPSCKVQGMENEAGNRFGLQFHPEVNDSEFGKEMFENFVEICRNHRDK